MPPSIPVGTALMVEREGAVLFIKRWGKHGAGTWSVPGGWVDSGEDPSESACREALEEVGLVIDPKATRFLGYTHELHPEGIEDVCLWFYVADVVGEPQICEPEKILALEWHRLDDLPSPLFTGFECALDKGILP